MRSAAVARDPPPSWAVLPEPETKLGRFIYFGCLFELELHQMREIEALRQENTKLRRTLRRRRVA